MFNSYLSVNLSEVIYFKIGQKERKLKFTAIYAPDPKVILGVSLVFLSFFGGFGLRHKPPLPLGMWYLCAEILFLKKIVQNSDKELDSKNIYFLST